MKKFNTVTETVEQKILVSKTCDVCKKEYPVYDDLKQVINDTEINEFVHIKNNCGYGSIIGDGDTVEIDVCQYCFKKMFEKYWRIVDSQWG